MSDYPDSATASSSAKSPAFAEALLKAKQIASKIKPDSSSNAPVGIKRPLEDQGEGPELKKPASDIDPYGAQLAASKMMMPGSAVPGEQASTEIIMVPDKMVGLIIGRGGEQITRLQAETGCKIQMAQESGGMPERQCTLTGNPGSIAQAKAAIDRIIANEGNSPAPRPPNMMGGGMNPNGGGGGPGFFEMMVPGHKVGLIIGKGGEMIKSLQEQSGAKIVIIQDSPEAAHEKPIRITGAPESVEVAKGLVNDILNQNDDRDPMGFSARGRGRGGMFRGAPRGGFGMRGAPRGGGVGMGRGGFGGPGGWNGGPGGNEYGGQATDYVQVPANKCGLIIGKGGETIKNINSSTGTHCEIDKNAPPDAREKTFIIRGAPDAVERAKNMILEKVGMNAANYGYGGGGGSWGATGYGQQGFDASGAAGAAINPQTGQPDYSAQWAEYYRSMGMTAEAEAIEAARARGGAPAGGVAAQPNGAAPAAPAAAPAPAGGAQNGGPDYSAQWAEYYRSIGKHKEAEAIEAQIKQKAASGAPTPSSAPGAGQASYVQPGYPGYYGNYVSQ